MADLTDSFIRLQLGENEMRLPISPEKPADVASAYVISSSVPEGTKNNDKEFKKIDHSLGEVLKTSCESTSCGNQSSKNASVEQEVSRYQTCNRVAALQGDKNDADCIRNSDSRCYMHEDLVFEIMLRLPVASLLRFRSVSRLWRLLIDSHTFITQHYNLNCNKSCLLAHRLLPSSYNDDYDSKFCLLSGHKYEMYTDLDFEQPGYSLNEIAILNSCNGIVSLLLNRKSGDVALWNPATKQSRPLPKSTVYRQLLCNEMIVAFGFGFDAKSNDYKFVRILYCYQNKHNNLVEIYSLRSDSWRTIHKDDVLPFLYIDCHVATCKNGTCFWIAYGHLDEVSPMLISLDLNTEVFETLPLPGEHDPSYYKYDYNALDLLKDKLCYIRSVNLGLYDINHVCSEIWTLDENDAKECWRKICNYGPTGSSEMEPTLLVGFSQNGRFLLLGYWCRYSELYLSKFDAGEEYVALQNPKPSPSKLVCYHELQNPNPIVLEVVHFSESLVSLKRKDDGVNEI